MNAEAVAVPRLVDSDGMKEENEKQASQEEVDYGIASAELIRKEIEQSQDLRKILLCTNGTLLGQQMGLHIDPGYNELERDTQLKRFVSEMSLQLQQTWQS